MITNTDNILLETASNFRERQFIREMSEYEKKNMSTNLVSKLYDSLLNKAHAKFDSIDDSKGDITKYIGYKTMMETMDALKKFILSSRGVTLPKEWETIYTAINNIERQKTEFTVSYKLNRQLGKLLYCTMVAAAVESITLLLVSSIEFVKNPTMGQVVIATKMTETGYFPIQKLEEFNMSIGNGEFSKVMKTINTTDKNQIVGEAVMIPFAIVGGIVALVVILRELVFYFYYGRMKLADFLDYQKTFLEYNVSALEADRTLDNSKKGNIIKKQKKIIEKLDKWADKIRVNHKMSAIEAKDALAKEKKEYSLDTLSNDPKTSKIEFAGLKLL